MNWTTLASRRARAALRSRPSRVRVEPLEDRQLLTTIVALAEPNQLLRFDSEKATAIIQAIPIGGLQAAETVVGIDVRPKTGQLYALANNAGAGRLYTVDLGTGAATLVAPLTASPSDPYTSLVGTDFGIDFNPVTDRLRVVSDTNQDLRINTDNGQV